MSEISFPVWLQESFRHPSPRTWQAVLASRTRPANRIIRVPTGFGKTEGVLSVWSYHLFCRNDQSWPRRLIWCLPTRSLTEPTYTIANSLAESINSKRATNKRLRVHLATGGEDSDDWFLYPESPAIVVGTQESLLSRALNRGFGSTRSRWPIEFGMLNQDSLWVMDEAQLMGVGLATSAQLQAYRDQDRSRSLKPCYTWWMSATMQAQWLDSVDTRSSINDWLADPCVLSDTERDDEVYQTKKPLFLKSIDAKATPEFAELIVDRHRNIPTGKDGRLTLVICNTVKRACETFEHLRSMDLKHDLKIVHSQFRRVDSESWRVDFLSKESRKPTTDRIIVSTQVIEAGVDFSADCVVTELAPWSSLVQRFGRCARYGGTAEVVVIDRGRDSKTESPYTSEELEAAHSSLETLNDVGIRSLEDYEQSLSETERMQLYHYSPQHLLMRTEFDELFDTTPDLSCDDIDVSRFIRSGDERDLQIFWLKIDKDGSPDPNRQPHRHELCPVKVADAISWLFGEESKSSRMPNLLPRMKKRAWIWDWIDGRWITPKRSDLLPGKIVCVASNRGGYSSHLGFEPDSMTDVTELSIDNNQNAVLQANWADQQLSNDSLSFNGRKTLARHSQEVVDCVTSITSELHLNQRLVEILTIAARWHDIGKAHPAFQSILHRSPNDNIPGDALLAKSNSTNRERVHYFADQEGRDERVGFRHELASALALFAVLQIYQPDHPALLGEWKAWFSYSVAGTPDTVTSSATSFNASERYASPEIAENNHIFPDVVEPLLKCNSNEFDLILYLVASHHGKVRSTLYSSPSDQNYVDQLEDGRGMPIRGIREGDILPELTLQAGDIPLPELILTLEPASLGLSPITGRSWRERTSSLVTQYGPSTLAYLEAIFRSADARATLLTTSDPLCEVQEIL